MKRPLIIILGAILVLILLGVWVYVLLTGDQQNADRFAGFDLGDTTDPSVVITPDDTADEPVVDVTEPVALRQLTTGPVAGFTEVRETATSTGIVHYVEAGTGHIMTINLDTGAEERISATTIPVTRTAAITPNGRHVLVEAGSGATTEYIVGSIATSSDELSNFALADNITSFDVTSDSRILYSVIEGGNTAAKLYNPITNTTQTLFTVPLRDVTIDWHHTATGPHLVYPKTSSLLEGFIYSYTNGALTRLPVSGYGLSAAGSEEYVLVSRTISGELETSAFGTATEINQVLPIDIIPDKCAFPDILPSVAVCGGTLVEITPETSEQWFRGEARTNDQLWEIVSGSSDANLLVDIEPTAGQVVDVINLQFNTFGTALYFQNKIDGTLWMYDFTI